MLQILIPIGTHSFNLYQPLLTLISLPLYAVILMRSSMLPWIVYHLIHFPIREIAQSPWQLSSMIAVFLMPGISFIHLTFLLLGQVQIDHWLLVLTLLVPPSLGLLMSPRVTLYRAPSPITFLFP